MNQNKPRLPPDTMVPGTESGRSPAAETEDEASKESARERAGERPLLSVIIPAYNEEDSVAQTVRSVDSTVDRVCDLYEIVVVDDGSEDGTREELRDVSEDLPSVSVVARDENQGKGYALRDGCRMASGEFVLFMDADGDLTPNRIETYLRLALEEDADVVVGSKRHPESELSYPLKRRVLSRGYSSLIRLLFGLDVSDTQVGLKLFRWRTLEEVMPLLLVERYAYDIELLALAHRRGYTITEAPVSIDFDGGSSVNWREVWRIGWDTLAVYTRLQFLQSYERLENAVRYARDSDTPRGAVEGDR